MRFVIVLIGLLPVTACSAKPYVLKLPIGAIDSEPMESIYVVSHGWHTGFVIPSKHVDTELPALRRRFGEVPSYEFGWGDAGFYQAKQITFKLTAGVIMDYLKTKRESAAFYNQKVSGSAER